MMKTVFKILFVLILAFATIALFASPDGPDIIADFDREIFSGFSAMLVVAVWSAVLFGLFRRKKTDG